MGITSHSIISVLWAAGNVRMQEEEKVTSSLKEQYGSVSHLSGEISGDFQSLHSTSLYFHTLCNH